MPAVVGKAGTFQFLQKRNQRKTGDSWINKAGVAEGVNCCGCSLVLGRILKADLWSYRTGVLQRCKEIRSCQSSTGYHLSASAPLRFHLSTNTVTITVPQDANQTRAVVGSQ